MYYLKQDGNCNDFNNFKQFYTVLFERQDTTCLHLIDLLQKKFLFQKPALGKMLLKKFVKFIVKI